MLEGRRHSVDVPLSKALVALKRVRSLRDPETNSMGKFPMSIEHMNWETNSASDPILRLDDHNNGDLTEGHHFHSNGERDAQYSDVESVKSSRLQDIKLSSAEKSSKHRIGDRHSTRTKAIRELCGEHRLRFDSSWLRHSPDLFEEEVDSYSDLNREVPEKINGKTRRKTVRSELRRPSAAAEKTVRRCMGSPYLSPSSNAFSPRTLGFFSEEPGVMDSNQNGCGLGSCWSRTPKYRDMGCLSDGEEQSHPLLVGEVHKPTFKERNPYPGSPRGLSQKFRPRSFDEFVGQPVVVQSLGNAVCKGKVCPMYLFYGPQGTGKTSMARIFAASLNCLSLGEKMPCGICRECVSFFSGRSRDIKELDPVHINCKDKVKALLKSASLIPCSSRYRVFIIDECQTLLIETWAAILKSLTELSRQVVFIMITSDLEKLPQISLSRCQKYHFPKIKDADIVWRLQKICLEEAYDFDDDALTFIAAKSNGSLREAETMLDQLSLLGKRITVSLAHELTGVVSEDELLDLLDLALSSDTSNTVRRARELMSSRVDPMQLTSQLANLIMDILAGRCRTENSVGRKFFGRHRLADVGLQKLRNALKVLSETDKQLRSSKSCATWLTVALLQFNTGDTTDVDDSMTLVQTSDLKDDALCRSFSTRESLQSSLCECNLGRSNCFEGYCNATKKLDTIWRRTIESCQSDPARSFLKKGRLASIYLKQGLAIAQVEFSSPEYVSRAEASWKVITSSLQHVLCHNVELRISLVRCSSLTKAKELTYRLLGCSGKRQYTFDSIQGDALVDPRSPEKHVEPLHHPNTAASLGAVVQGKLARKPGSDSHITSKGVVGEEDLATPAGNRRGCFGKLQRTGSAADPGHISVKGWPRGRMVLSVPRKASLETFLCTTVPYIFCSRANSKQTCRAGKEEDR